MQWLKSDWEAAPSFSISGSSNNLEPYYSNVIAVYIRGLDDNIGMRCFEDSQSKSISEVQSFKYKPKDVVDQITQGDGLRSVASALLDQLHGYDKDYCIQLFVRDVGGLIVKQALLIASRDNTPENVRLLDRVSLITFFGTPHRATRSQNWEAIAWSLLYRAYRGLLGDWTSDFVTNFSHQQARLAVDFLHLAPRFRIVNYFQDPPSTWCCKPVIHKSCATLGIQDEINIGLPRNFVTLSKSFYDHEADYLNNCVESAAIQSWETFRAFMKIFYMRQIASSSIPESSFDYHQVICTLAALPDIEESLQACSPNNIVQLHCSHILNPVKLFTGLKNFLEAMEPRRKHIFIRLDSSIYARGRLDEGRLYASLCHQILTQQPQLFFHVRHLYSNLEDAVRSNNKTWRARAMWNCFCVLLRYPRDAAMYCFIEDDSLPTTKSFTARLIAATVKSEIRLGVVATIADRSKPLFPKHATLELTTEHFAPSLKSDISMWINTLRELNELSISDDMFQLLLDNLAAVRTYGLLDDAVAFFLQQQSLLTTAWSITTGFKDLTDTEYLSSLIANQVNRHGRWLLVPAVWALYAVRPISQDELDEILSMHDVHTSDDDGNQHHTGPRKFQDFANILPGLMWIRRGKVGLLDAARSSFELLWDSYFSDFRSPHQLLTKTCLIALLNAFKKNDIISSQPVRPIETNFEKYAAKYWMFHFKQERDIHQKDDIRSEKSLIEDFLKSDENTKAWLAHLRSDRQGNRESVDLDDDICCQIIPTTLSRQFSLDIIRASDLSCQLAEITVRSASDVADALLLIAVETSDMDMTKGILLTDPSTRDRIAFCRAIAAAPKTIRDEILKVKTPILESYFDRILLTSISIGHQNAIDFLLQKHQQRMKSSLESETNRGLSCTALSDKLPTPLQVAIQFSETGIIDKLLQPGTPWWGIEESSTGPEAWNSLHHAAASGCEEILAKILGRLEFSEPSIQREMMNAETSFGNTPLLLAACQGSYGTSHQLLRYGGHNPDGQINPNIWNSQLYTAPMVTARLGYSRLHKTLLHQKGFDNTIQGHSLGRLLKASLCHDHLATAQVTLESNPELIKQNGNDMDFSRKMERISVDWSDSDSTSTSSEHLNESEDELISAFNIAVCRNMIQIVEHMLKSLSEILDINSNPSSRDNIPVLLAARSGSESILSRLLQAGADIGLRNASGKTALHIASYWGHMASVDVLLKHKASYNKNSCSNDSEEEDYDSDDDYDDGDYCTTPIQEAIRCNQRHIIDLLLPSARLRGQTTSIHTASYYGHCDILEWLLSKSLDINITSYVGRTALHLASYWRHPRCVKLLLLRGAKSELSDSIGFTAVTDAAMMGSLESLNLLIGAGAVLDNPTKQGKTPLCLAIEADQNECVEALLKGGASLTLCPYYTTKYKGIIDFTMHYSSKTLQVLLQFYKSQENKRKEIRTKFCKELVQALQIAIRNLDPSVLEVLLGFYDADIDFGEPWTIVHFAAAFGSQPSLQMVLNDPRMQPMIHISKRWLGTPLQVAARSSKEGLDKVKYILNNQQLAVNVAFVHTGSRFGTALNAAISKGDTEMINVILGHLNSSECSYDCLGGRHGSALHWIVACWCQFSPDEVTMLDLLREHGVPGTAKGIQGSDILHYAVRFTDNRTIRHLLDWPEVSVQTVDIQGRLALHMAAIENNDGILKLLKGPDTTIRTTDKVGRNAVHFAAGHNSMTVLRAILDDDQNLDLISVADKDGWLPIHWASRHCGASMLEYLLKKAQLFHGDTWIEVAQNMKTTDSHSWTPSQIASFHGKDAETTFCKYFQTSGDTSGARNGDKFSDSRPMRATCDSCHCEIYRERYHCTHEACFDFDLCFKCVKHHTALHISGHSFKKITIPASQVDYSIWEF